MSDYNYKKGDIFKLAAGKGEADLRSMGYSQQESIDYIIYSEAMEVTRYDKEGRVYYYNGYWGRDSWIWDYLTEPAKSEPKRNHLLTRMFESQKSS